jgi:hypothetical protein
MLCESTLWIAPHQDLGAQRTSYDHRAILAPATIASVFSLNADSHASNIGVSGTEDESGRADSVESLTG